MLFLGVGIGWVGGGIILGHGAILPENRVDGLPKSDLWGNLL
jgi:hypothetical protein